MNPFFLCQRFNWFLFFLHRSGSRKKEVPCALLHTLCCAGSCHCSNPFHPFISYEDFAIIIRILFATNYQDLSFTYMGYLSSFYVNCPHRVVGVTMGSDKPQSTVSQLNPYWAPLVKYIRAVIMVKEVKRFIQISNIVFINILHLLGEAIACRTSKTMRC